MERPMTTASPSPETRSRRWDARLVTALVAVGSCGALMAVTAAFAWGARFALSVGAGATIAGSNLYVLSKIVGAMMQDRAAGDSQGAGAGTWGVLAMVKMIVLFGGIWLVMTKGLVDPMGLVLGYGSLPIGIAIGSIVSDKTGVGT
jgi:hypothetical protein